MRDELSFSRADNRESRAGSSRKGEDALTPAGSVSWEDHLSADIEVHGILHPGKEAQWRACVSSTRGGNDRCRPRERAEGIASDIPARHQRADCPFRRIAPES